MTREEILQTAKPILFNTEMVRAILDDRKTVTRRIIKLPYGFSGHAVGEIGNEENPIGFMYPGGIKRPPYQLGDILYVRETWHKYKKRVGKGEDCHIAEFYGYKASIANSEDANESWKPSIHMPKEAARIFLKVTDVRVERLQDITEEQAEQEGVGDLFYEEIGYDDKNYGNPVDEKYGIAKEQFAWLWNSTIKKSDIDIYGWDADPYVWIIEFERIEV